MSKFQMTSTTVDNAANAVADRADLAPPTVEGGGEKDRQEEEKRIVTLKEKIQSELDEKDKRIQELEEMLKEKDRQIAQVTPVNEAPPVKLPRRRPVRFDTHMHFDRLFGKCYFLYIYGICREIQPC